MNTTNTHSNHRSAATTADCCPGRALYGWSPPRLPADTTGKRWVDRILPSTGVPVTLYYAAVITLLLLAPYLSPRAELAVEGLAALAAGVWCSANFWRCRHAHCLVTGAGWLGLSVFVFAEAGIGHSLIAGYEQPVFLGILLAGLAFEAFWYLTRGTHALTCAPTPAADRDRGTASPHSTKVRSSD